MSTRRNQLELANQLIADGKRNEARKLLVTICRRQPGAEAYWLLSTVLEDTRQVEKALRLALKYDPDHALAADTLRKLRQSQELTDTSREVPLETLPLVTEREQKEADAPAPSKRKAKKTSVWFRNLVRVVMVVAGVLIGGSAYVLFHALTYDVPYPLTGRYYVSGGVTITSETLPCPEYTIYGDVINGAGYSIRVTTDLGFDQVTDVDSNGRFRLDIPQEAVIGPTLRGQFASPYSGYVRDRIDQVVSVRLLDRQGVDQSGIRTTPFYHYGCAVYFEYRPFDGGLKFGRPPEIEELSVVQPRYQIMRSELTTVPQSLLVGYAHLVFTCDWIGVMGRAYAPDGPVDFVSVQAYQLGGTAPRVTSVFTGQLAYNTGHSEYHGVWMLPLEPGHYYYIEFLYRPEGYLDHNLMGTLLEVPAETDCQGHVFLMTLMPIQQPDAPPYLP